MRECMFEAKSGSTTPGKARGLLRWMLAAFLLMAMASSHALTVVYGGMNRAPNPSYYDTSAGGTLAMIQPGNQALIDDAFVNNMLTIGGSVEGDSFGVRSTDPTGVIQLNSLAQSSNCWRSGLTSYCPAYSYSFWEMGTNVAFKPLGLWKLEVLNNGAVIDTRQFQLVPYKLDKNSGDGQSIAGPGTTPEPLAVRLTLPDGSAAPAGKSVTFAITLRPKRAKPPGGLSASATYSGSIASTLSVTTDASGYAKAYLDAGATGGSYAISASTPLAPGVTLAFTVIVSGTDPNDSAIDDKNQGSDQGFSQSLDPGEGNECVLQATKASTCHPINIGTGNKYRIETDYIGQGPVPLQFTRYYNSTQPRMGSMGGNWRGFYDRSVSVVSTPAQGKIKATTTAEVLRPDGKVFKFTLANGLWAGEADVIDKLESVSGGYKYTYGKDGVELYTSSGQLASIAAREGFAQTLSYDAQRRLATVRDAFSRTLTFTYDASGRLSQMFDPAGQPYSYSYDTAGNLTAVTYPDQKTRQYLYENAALPQALTGIIDENQARFATFSYDAAGRAVVSSLAGGAGQSEVTYYTDGSRMVTDANGTERKYNFSVIQGVPRRVSLDNGACASCGNASQLTGYNTNGFVTSVSDYKGVQTTFVRDVRGLESSRTEAAGTAVARTISTTWHPTYRLPLSISEPGRTTAFTYDSAGRTLTRTQTDTASGAARKWSYTYNALGLLTSIDGPRTDVSDITSFTYDAQGNLASSTNALGHLTQYTSHDAHGRPLRITDPSGLVTTLTYDLRGRVLSRSAGGLTTALSYDGAGQLSRVGHPDGSSLEYRYDAAYRLTGMADQLGNRISYALDGNGNITRQDTLGSSGALARTRSWAYDQLNRVSQEIDSAARVQARHAYDLNGNRISHSDALGQTSAMAYDALNRLSALTDPLAAVTAYGYDARDNLTQVIDPKGVASSYSFDGLDNRKQEASADAGTSSFSHDAAGNVRTRSWANGKNVALTLDALNRVTRQDYGGGLVHSYSYDSTANGNYGTGRLTGMSEPGGATAWRYDQHGRIVQKSQSVGARVLTTGYAWDSAGRLQSQTYPSGRQISYSYSAGQLSAISVDGQPLLQSIAWQPFGPASGWTQASGRSSTRSYDQDGQLASHSFDGGTRTLAYDAKGRISSISEPARSLAYSYDALDRLLGETAAASASYSYSYSYDANGNRLSKADAAGSAGYSYSANRLLGTSGAGASRSYASDAAGNLTADGLHGYGFDAANRLASVDGAAAQYQFNAQGQRVAKLLGGAARYAAYDGQGQLMGEYDEAGAVQETLYLGSIPVAVLKGAPGSSAYAIEADQLGAPRIVRDGSDTIVWRWDADAFGTAAANEDPGGSGAPFGYNLRFPGQYLDAESGLHYNWNRFYDPATGRYTQADPIGLAGGVNRFAYVEGNPLSFTDPEGLRSNGPPARGTYYPRGSMPQPTAFPRPDNASQAAGYFNPDGSWTCLKWNCPANSGSCSPNDLKSSTDFMPPQSNPMSPPSGCTCAGAPNWNRDFGLPKPYGPGVVDTARDLADMYNTLRPILKPR